VLREYLHKRGKTVIFVTNAIDYTDYCDRILVLSKGKIVDDGTPEELKSTGGIFGDLKMQYKKSKQHEE
jgi:ABC-type multidrug transport system ATPase subunit